MPENPDLVCFSHLRWGFVYQRPQHLLGRFARDRRVLFFEEPEYGAAEPALAARICPDSGVHIFTPQLPHGMGPENRDNAIERLVARKIAELDRPYIHWYYTPMALPFSRALAPEAIVYDCMDELSGFVGAPPELKELERELFSCADVVFTGGRTLYEAKKKLNPNVHAFPSSVDVSHFSQARAAQVEPRDQQDIPHPRIGYCGVIDERTDIDLLREVARVRPDWHFVMIGPVVKIDPNTLPRFENIHYVGQKSYKELPSYMSGWDAAILPFAHNDSTRFISPTKTPEYLAAGLPVVSTSIRDVVSPYGDLGLVRIADGAEAFTAALDFALGSDRHDSSRKARVDELLSSHSWDKTQAQMDQLIRDIAARRTALYTPQMSDQMKEDACSTI